jgi:multidrug transporter EmrE-like cation transporter
VIGLLVALLSAVVYAVGLGVEQRALHGSESISVHRPLHLARVLLGNPRWVFGCLFAAIGSVGLIVSLGLAPVSVAQPAYAAGVATTLLVITLVTGERITRGEYVALGIMPVALALLSLSTADGAEAGTSANTPLLVLVAVVTVVACVGAMGLAGGRGRYVSAAAMGAAAGLAQGSAGLQGKGLGGLLAEHGVLGAVVPALLSPFPYLYAVGWAVGLVLFQTSMQRSRASITAPVSNVVGNVFMVVAGTILFDESLPDDPVMLGLRVGGFALTLVVIVLVRGNVASAEADTSRKRAAAPVPGGAETR